MRTLLPVTALVIAGACAPRLTQNSGNTRATCPPDNASARRVVEKFQSSPLLAQERANAGVTPGAHAFRALGADRDSTTCTRLWSLTGEAGRFTFYASDELYFVVGDRPATSEFTPLLIVKPDFTLVASLAM